MLVLNLDTPRNLTVEKVKTSAQRQAEYEMPLHKRARRKLMASPLTTQNLQDSSQSCPNPMVESLSEAFCPITYTPEVCKKQAETLCTGTVIKKVLHTATLEEMSHMAQIQEPLKQSNTKDVTYNVTPECHMNSTMLCKNNTDTIDSSDAARSKSETANSRSVLQRYFM